jgi:probable HAF family extracellular repeat protein
MAVGWSGTFNGSVSHAFIWSGGGIHDLGALHSGANSAALAINAMGEVVGWADASDGTPHAFLWRAGHMQDLNQSIPEYSGWVLIQASGINRRGEITGTGLHDGQTHAFLLTSLEGSDGGG